MRRKPDAIEVAAVLLLLGTFAFGYSMITRPEKADYATAVAPTVPAGDSGAYELTYFDPATGDPIRFNPCEPIHYVVNDNGMPDWALPIVHEAVKEVGSATGIEMVFDGTTEEPVQLFSRNDGNVSARASYDPERYGVGRWAPLLIAWGDLSGLADDTEEGVIDGTASASAAQGEDGRIMLVSGLVALDPNELSRRSLKLVAMHELGHVFGLGHVDNRRQMMFTGHTYVSGNPRFGAGDLNGLRLLGRDGGCLPSLSPPAPDVPLRAARRAEGS